jgi:uncharacterized protein YyaL (SSP411 family)
VFLSVGYSACHWCHVMAHESFDDEATAAFLNEHFVCVKVDREERPDVDSIYMDAVQTLTGSGGWPMSVFLTPDAAPFYGGTYFPPVGRYGMPAFIDVLRQLASLWETRREEVLRAAAGLTSELQRQLATPPVGGAERLDPETLEMATEGLWQAFDRDHGGWGAAPKFPQPSVVEFVLRRYHATGDDRLLTMATRTLDAMMRGGIYDHLGGGFHRYATDEIWLVPHFEKMLYDNAQLARLYLHGWQVTGNEDYRRVVTETLDYVTREMTDPAGGWYSAQDADSEGVEGRFFVWTPAQVDAALHTASDDPEGDARLFFSAYGVSEQGNFEGANILHLERTAAELAEESGQPAVDVQRRLDGVRESLRVARERRLHPGRDDKVLAATNGLMLAAFAEAARVLDRSDFRATAEKNAGFVLAQMRTEHGRMLRSWKGGSAKLNGYLEDYSHFADGLLELYQTTFDPQWFEAAVELTNLMLAHFADPAGGFFDTSDDHEALIVRPKGLQDGAIPSGGAIAARVVLRLAALTGEGRYADAGEGALAPVQQMMARAPLGFAQWLDALDFALAPPTELALVGDDAGRLLAVARARYRPNLVVASGPSEPDSAVALLRERPALGGLATAYACHGQACERPVTDPAELEAHLRERE